MKTNIIYKGMLCFLMGATVLFSSCNDYLNEKPKGKNIPENLADYESMLRYEYGMHLTHVGQTGYLMNDIYCSASSLSSKPLNAANYNWDTTIDRIYWNNSDESAYYSAYTVIGTCNLIMESAMQAANATDAERKEVYAYAQVLRAMAYFQVANYYADTYNKATAATKLCVPYITSSEVNAPYTQLTIQQIYDNMLKDVEEALPTLPDNGTTVLHPGKGAAYAFLARVYLQMMDYTHAKEYADKALAINDKLFDWNAFYTEHQTVIEDATNYTRYTSPMNFTFVESYNFKHGSSSYSGAGISLPTWRAAGFEEGDAHFLSCWKFRDYGGGTAYYYPMVSGYFNYGGMRTTEVYLIKAECLARENKLDEAMKVLNEVRVKRILPASYKPLTANSVAEAIGFIRQTKNNEMLGSIMPFADTRRYNSEGTYPVTLSRTVDGKTTTLAPDSYLWTMPFPQGAISNPGGGSIQQNVEK